MTYQTILPQGEYYLDMGTGKTIQQIPRADLPRKIVVFSCGGGSFVEYENIKNLNQELGCMQFNDVENDANKNPYFDQVLYGTDHIFSPQEFVKELKDFYAKWENDT